MYVSYQKWHLFKRQAFSYLPYSARSSLFRSIWIKVHIQAAQVKSWGLRRECYKVRYSSNKTESSWFVKQRKKPKAKGLIYYSYATWQMTLRNFWTWPIEILLLKCTEFIRTHSRILICTKESNELFSRSFNM